MSSFNRNVFNEILFKTNLPKNIIVATADHQLDQRLAELEANSVRWEKFLSLVKLEHRGTFRKTLRVYYKNNE